MQARNVASRGSERVRTAVASQVEASQRPPQEAHKGQIGGHIFAGLQARGQQGQQVLLEALAAGSGPAAGSARSTLTGHSAPPHLCSTWAALCTGAR